MADFTGLIPAAGLGRRAGGPKAALVLPDDPRPLLKRCIDGLIRAGARQVIVVVRPEHLALTEHPRVTAVAPDPPTQSMIESVRLGLLALERQAGGDDGLLLCPVDAARAAEASHRWLPAALSAHGSCAVIPTFQGAPGHPAWLPRNLWGRLHQDPCSTHGAKAAFAGAAHWAVTDPAVLDNVNVRT